MEEEVSAPGRLSLPSTLELMTRRLLKPGQLPGGPLDTQPNRLDERLEREEPVVRRARHEPGRPSTTLASCRVMTIWLTLLPDAL